MIKIYKGTTHFIYFFSKVKQSEANGKWKRSRMPDQGKYIRTYFSFYMNLLYKSPNIEWMNFKIL